MNKSSQRQKKRKRIFHVKVDLEDYGEMLYIEYGSNGGKTKLVFDITALSDILGYSDNQTVSKFIRDKIIPLPINKCRFVTKHEGYKIKSCYTLEEIQPIVSLIEIHRKEHGMYIKQTHRDLINNIFSEVKKVRQTNYA